MHHKKKCKTPSTSLQTTSLQTSDKNRHLVSISTIPAPDWAVSYFFNRFLAVKQMSGLLTNGLKIIGASDVGRSSCVINVIGSEEAVLSAQ